ncbi:MAG: VOC family protein [Burkholderiales bacterium]|nr:VOC family protein [Burkholderiales bacterium]
MDIKGLHHVAYRCKNARQTADFYTRVLKLDYLMAVSEDRVPSTKEDSPYFHLFFRMDDGSFIAFFELPESPAMGRDDNTPQWVQHLALRVPDEKTLLDCKKHIESCGVEVVGPIDHTICQSIYFFDPNGHRLELAWSTVTPDMVERLQRVSQVMLDDWDRTKRAPRHADWVHAKALGGSHVPPSQ